MKMIYIGQATEEKVVKNAGTRIDSPVKRIGMYTYGHSKYSLRGQPPAG
jgi:hypothetical protein